MSSDQRRDKRRVGVGGARPTVKMLEKWKRGKRKEKKCLKGLSGNSRGRATILKACKRVIRGIRVDKIV